MIRAGAALLAVAVAAACGPKGKAAPAVVEVPSRKPTAGERILALAPAGADAILEIDIARLRKNRAVGPVLEAVGATAQVSGNLAASSDLLVFVSYGVGDADAQQLVFAAGPRVTSLDGGARLADDLVVFGPPALLKQVEASAAGVGATGTLAGDRALQRARAMAMPARRCGCRPASSSTRGSRWRASSRSTRCRRGCRCGSTWPTIWRWSRCSAARATATRSTSRAR